VKTSGTTQEVDFRGDQEARRAPQDFGREERKTDPTQEARSRRQERWQDRAARTARALAAQDEQIPVKKQKPHPQQITLC